MADLSSIFATPLPDYMARNKQFLAEGPQGVRLNPSGYATELSPLDEMAFRAWLQKNKVPFDPNANGATDYDMRGYWRALQQQDPRARSGVDPNDNRLHYTDTFKTPYHETFSAESEFAGPYAPTWNSMDQLIAPSGRILFDDRKR